MKKIRTTTSAFLFGFTLGYKHESVLHWMLDLRIFSKNITLFLLILIGFFFPLKKKILLVSVVYEIRSSCDRRAVFILQVTA